jgi:hypothetical protein
MKSNDIQYLGEATKAKTISDAFIHLIHVVNRHLHLGSLKTTRRGINFGS